MNSTYVRTYVADSYDYFYNLVSVHPIATVFLLLFMISVLDRLDRLERGNRFEVYYKVTTTAPTVPNAPVKPPTKTKIYRTLLTSDGLTAKQLSDILDVDKSKVNSVLYANENTCFQRTGRNRNGLVWQVVQDD